VASSFSLRALVVRGELAGARPGMLRGELLALLGAPDEWGVGAVACEHAAIWRYGNLELHFDAHDRCWMLFSDYVRAGLDAGEGRTLEPWIAGDEVAYAAVVQRLRDEAIEFTERQEEAWRFVQVRGGARLSFDEDGCWAVVDVSAPTWL